MPTEPSTSPSADREDAQTAAARRILGMTRATYAKLEPHVAMLTEALVARKADTATLSLKSERTVQGLRATFGEDAGLRERVAAHVRRFEEVAATLAEVEAALASQSLLDAQVAGLKQGALFLAKFHELAGHDVLLEQLFPSPRLLEADASHGVSGQ